VAERSIKALITTEFIFPGIGAVLAEASWRYLQRGNLLSITSNIDHCVRHIRLYNFSTLGHWSIVRGYIRNWGRAIAQAVIRWLPTAAVRGSSPGLVMWDFVVDKVALGQVFSAYFGFPCQFSFHQLLQKITLIYHRGLYNRPEVAAVPGT
jgi:hypothetical protein